MKNACAFLLQRIRFLISSEVFISLWYAFLLLLPCLVSANWDQVFFGDDDPSLFHHVNVMTGNLNLCLQDHIIEGAKPLHLMRTYSSSGALERNYSDTDLKLKDLRGGWLVQGGWNFFPHTNLLIEMKDNTDWNTIKMFVSEPSGSITIYKFSKKTTHTIILKPEIKNGQISGAISARSDRKNSWIELFRKKYCLTLHLANGGRRYYKAVPNAINQKQIYYYLDEEVLSSGHKMKYEYDDKKRLKHISLTNLAGNKVFGWMDMQIHQKKVPYHFEIKTSDGKKFNYKALAYKKRDYLSDVESSCRFHEVLQYQEGRKGIGARLGVLNFGERLQFAVKYYLPSSKKKALKWIQEPFKKPIKADKVRSLKAPFGPQGEMIKIAAFKYLKDHTDVRDADHLLTRFYHQDERISEIEYFGQNDQFHSGIRFSYKGDRLQNKIFLDRKKQGIFSKTFHYDPAGNVIEEIFQGNLTGLGPSSFAIDSKGNLIGAESYHKKFSYDPKTQLTLREEEEGGPVYLYSYKPETDLLTAKLTCDHEKILIRNFYHYNDDNLLVAEIVDNGSSAQVDDFSQVTYRQIKKYERDPQSGLIKTAIEAYWDPQSQSERVLKRVEYLYSPENRVIEEVIYDEQGNYRYTLHIDYNAQGKVVRKTDPLGQANTYIYDLCGQLLKAKEVGKPEKIYTYDPAGHPRTCEEIDEQGKLKRISTIYDAKGRLITQVDRSGNRMEQTYDAFGRCLETRFPETLDENGSLYCPAVQFEYDIQGNIIAQKSPQGEVTRTSYNSLRHPVRIMQADGTQILHFYNTNSTLAKTIYPDQTVVVYLYDLLKRMVSKETSGANGELLSSESWHYDAFCLLSHTNTEGLTTIYRYDRAGRKITEEAEGRLISYSYDALGFQERVTIGESSHVQIHDDAGRVIEEWDEDSQGHIENRMAFSYNGDNRKEKAVRLTSQGEATDLFQHDSEGRLIRHTDPYGAVTQILYDDEAQNDQGQTVLRKTTLDPLGNQRCETYDVLNRLVFIEHKDAQGHAVSGQSIFYDCSGNKAKVTSIVYHQNQPMKSITTCWEYDEMGRVIREIESGKKETAYRYDSRGRLSQKILPSKIEITYIYDGIDRIVEMVSSDHTVHYQYRYESSRHPVEIADLISNMSFYREYNNFGELLKEISPFGFSLRWNYDYQGRCTEFQLPDSSSLFYRYSGNHLKVVQRYSASQQFLYEHKFTEYDVNGQISEEEFACDLGSLHTSYDLMERPETQTSQWIQHQRFYGPSGLVMQTKNSLFGDKAYSYDALNQLLSEGKQDYRFDSLGNRLNCTINELNQVISSPTDVFSYDADGNPIQRANAQGITCYKYDALGRLKTLIDFQGRQIDYQYDPFSQLISKKVTSSQVEDIFFIYHQGKEVGSLNHKKEMVQFKVLSLGAQEDRGTALALELQGELCIPLHDFQGNVIALIDSNGNLTETYNIDSFGQETLTPSHPRNPWRFCSKRVEEGLVYFGFRFYDPSLGRWLTPDPAGFADSYNLYLYVRNSPLNRLDLFGLISEPNANSSLVSIEAQIQSISQQQASGEKFLHCKGRVGEVVVDLLIAWKDFRHLQYTQEELARGSVNILDHVHEFIPKNGMAIGLTTLQNGIDTSVRELEPMCRSVTDRLPDSDLFIGIHLPTEGPRKDMVQTGLEGFGVETSAVITTRQVLIAIGEKIHKINPMMGWLHIAHSRGGGVYKRAYEGMTPDQQKNIIQSHLYVVAFAPSQPIPKDYGRQVINLYSREDYVTGRATKQFLSNPNFNIQFLPCQSKWYEKNLFIADHGFMRKTYQNALEKNLDILKFYPGFYETSSR